MTEFVTKSGRVLTDADIQALADEAEAGYDVSHLKEQQSRTTQGASMSIVPIAEAAVLPQVTQLDRFTVTASGASPEPASQGIRTHDVEENWLAYLGPTAMMFARRVDHYLSNLKDGQQSIAVIVTRWAEALGVFPEEILAAKNRLIRFGLAEWTEKGHILSIHRNWPPVPAAIKTPEHRQMLLSIPDLRFDIDNPEEVDEGGETDPG